MYLRKFNLENLLRVYQTARQITSYIHNTHTVEIQVLYLLWQPQPLLSNFYVQFASYPSFTVFSIFVFVE